MEIINIIRDNKLMYLEAEDMARRISILTNRDKESILSEINGLVQSGELFVDEKGKISISKDRGYYLGKMSLNKKGYGFVSVEGMSDFFIPQFAINGAFDGDDCLVEIFNMKTSDDIEGRVVKVLRRNTTHIVGTFIEGGSKNVVFPDDAKLPQIRIFKNDGANAKNNYKVWVELDMSSLETENVRGRVMEVLGQANTPKAEQISIIRSFGLVDSFSPEVMNCVKSIDQNVDKKNFKDRVDFTEQNVITIDGEDARDFDDALAIERLENGYRLYVHIADVSNYVVENSALDKSAYERGTSVYFPNMVIPMLPKEISNGVCSLSEGVDRLVLTVIMELDKDCNVISSKIVEGIINSKHRMTYTEVENILNGDELLREKYADVVADIEDYFAISKKLKEKKRARGEIRMNLPEPFILENSKGEIVSIENRIQDESHELIESLMVLTNECVAKTFYDLALPFVYRVHEKPDSEKVARLSQFLTNNGVANELQIDGDKPISYQRIIDKITGSTKEKILTKLILRTMMKARYLPTCLGHFGLASEYYCHFTSPIRRYPDLMIHRIIKNFIHGVPREDLKIKYKPIVERASERSSETERNADEAEREVDDYKKAVYMSKFLGEEFDGIISGVQEFGIFVELENGIEGMIKLDNLPMDEYVFDDMGMALHGTTNHFVIGDEVKIIVANTNTRLRQIDFELAGDIATGGRVLRIKEDKKSSKSTRKTSKKVGKVGNNKRNIKKSTRKRR